MTDQEAFLTNIALNPEDDVLRNIYADWLEEHDMIEESNRQRKYLPSMRWLKRFVEDHNCPEYEILIEGAVKGGYVSEEYKIYGDKVYPDDEYLTFIGNDAHGPIPPELWEHIEIVTGKKITHRPEHFYCSC